MDPLDQFQLLFLKLFGWALQNLFSSVPPYFAESTELFPSFESSTAIDVEYFTGSMDSRISFFLAV